MPSSYCKVSMFCAVGGVGMGRERERVEKACRSLSVSGVRVGGCERKSYIFTYRTTCIPYDTSKTVGPMKTDKHLHHFSMCVVYYSITNSCFVC